MISEVGVRLMLRSLYVSILPDLPLFHPLKRLLDEWHSKLLTSG
jgi:hypothetical protein